MTTSKKDQRWAILPPKAPSAEVATSTEGRARNQDGQALPPGADEEGHEPEAREAAVSRRRARTEPELPGLDKLVSEVARPISTPRPPPFEPQGGARLTSPARDAATAPPEGSATLLSPASESHPPPMPTLIDRMGPGDVEPEEPIVVKRSRLVAPTAKGPTFGEGGETLPSPPWRDDES